MIDINSDNADETKLIAGLRSQSLDKAGTKLLSTSSLLAAIGLSHYDQWTKAILRGKDFWNDVSVSVCWMLRIAWKDLSYPSQKGDRGRLQP